jgi:Flp pilus assembly protein TadG
MDSATMMTLTTVKEFKDKVLAVDIDADVDNKDNSSFVELPDRQFSTTVEVEVTPPNPSIVKIISTTRSTLRSETSDIFDEVFRIASEESRVLSKT